MRFGYNRESTPLPPIDPAGAGPSRSPWPWAWRGRRRLPLRCLLSLEGSQQRGGERWGQGVEPLAIGSRCV